MPRPRPVHLEHEAILVKRVPEARAKKLAGILRLPDSEFMDFHRRLDGIAFEYQYGLRQADAAPTDKQVVAALKRIERPLAEAVAELKSLDCDSMYVLRRAGSARPEWLLSEKSRAAEALLADVREAVKNPSRSFRADTPAGFLLRSLIRLYEEKTGRLGTIPKGNDRDEYRGPLFDFLWEAVGEKPLLVHRHSNGAFGKRAARALAAVRETDARNAARQSRNE